jgi:hypothetical protein
MHALEFIQIKCDQLAENKIFIGLVMIMVNIGARFIIEELSDEHRAIVQSSTFRKIVIFCSVFMATRDILISLVVLLIFTVVLHEVIQTKTISKDDKGEGQGKGSSFAKQELDKQIDQLKLIKDSL